jgi:hypothetical protein
VDGRDGLGGQRWPARKRRWPGRASLNQALISLAIAAVGYLIGVLLPLAVSSGPSNSRMFFAPVGGIVSGLFAVMAIVIGVRVRRFFRGANELQLQRIRAIMDVDREERLAAAGIALGVVCIIINPLIVYVIITIVRP